MKNASHIILTLCLVTIGTASHAKKLTLPNHKLELIKTLNNGSTYKNSRFRLSGCRLVHIQKIYKEAKCNDKTVYQLTNTYDLKYVKTTAGVHKNSIKLTCTNQACRKLQGDFGVLPFSCSSTGSKIDKTYPFGYLSMKDQAQITKGISAIRKVAKSCR